LDDRDPALDQFGEDFVHRVRDDTLTEIDDILVGRARPDWKRELYEAIDTSTNQDQRELLRHVVAIAVDTAMHNILWMFESTKTLNIEIVGPDAERHDIVEMSDGLSGELWTEDGWIARFSRDKDPGRSRLY
jgi:hypothetical protein